jgi:hypothetical protein
MKHEEKEIAIKTPADNGRMAAQMVCRQFKVMFK